MKTLQIKIITACMSMTIRRQVDPLFFKKKKEKKKIRLFLFVFWIDHFSFKNPHLYKIKNNPLSIWGTIFPTLEKTVCLCRSYLDKTENHVVCKLSVLSDKIFSKKQKQNRNFLFNIAYSSYGLWFVNYQLFCKKKSVNNMLHVKTHNGRRLAKVLYDPSAFRWKNPILIASIVPLVYIIRTMVIGICVYK